MAKHNEIGKIGEDLATKFLRDKGFDVFTRNFRAPYGEIDIVALKSGITHFVEVKTVSCENEVGFLENRAEENVTREKLQKLSRVIQVYINKEKVEKWQFDVCAVYLSLENKKASIRFLENQLLPE